MNKTNGYTPAPTGEHREAVAHGVAWITNPPEVVEYEQAERKHQSLVAQADALRAEVAAEVTEYEAGERATEAEQRAAVQSALDSKGVQS